jgi:hypothetical protein
MYDCAVEYGGRGFQGTPRRILDLFNQIEKMGEEAEAEEAKEEEAEMQAASPKH